jgi:hypothetical protein
MPDITIKPSVVGKGITPTMPTEPTPEAKAMVFTNDPMLTSSGDSTTITTDKGLEIKTEAAPIYEEVKTVEAVKEEAKPKQEVTTEKKSVLTPPVEAKTEVKAKSDTKAVETKSTIKPISPVRDKKEEDTFDYAKYTTDQQQVLKQMSNTAKREYAKVVDENKQLSSLKDSNYLQHEQGYTLSPQYQELQTKDYLARTEGRAWEQALLDIKQGAKFKDIVGFDNQNNPIYSEPRVATDRDEIRVTSNLNACISAVRNNEQTLQSFPNQFRQRMTQDLQNINAERHNRFAWVQDPKLLDYSVEVEGQGAQKIGDVKQNFKSLFPPYLSNSIAVEVASDMMVAMVIQSAELREAKNNQQVATIKQKELQRGEPTSYAAETSPSKLREKGVPSVFSLDGLPG